MSDTQQIPEAVPSQIPVTFVDFIAHSLRMRSDNGVGNCVLSLSGRLDEARLQRTLRLAMDYEPILGCQFVEHWRRPYWRRRQDLDALHLCRVFEGDEHRAEFVRFMTETIDPTRDPLMQAAVFRGATDTVCFKATHAIADGPSGARFFPAVIDIYRRLQTQPDYVPKPKAPGVRDPRSFARLFSLRQKLRFARNVLLSRRSGPPATWIFPEYREKKTFHGYVMLRLPPERVTRLFKYGLDRRATMTSVLLAGLYLAALKEFRPASDEVVTFSITTDLRRFLPIRRQDYTMSNMSGPGRFRLDPKRDRDPEAVLASIRDQLKQIMKDPTTIASPLALFLFLDSIPPLLLGRLVHRMMARASARPERRLGLTNVGEIDPGFLDFGDVQVKDAYLAGPLCMGPGLGLAFSTFRKTLTLIVGLSGRIMEESAVQRFLEQVDHALPFYEAGAGAVITLAAENGPGA